jgi:hypothetical protein
LQGYGGGEAINKGEAVGLFGKRKSTITFTPSAQGAVQQPASSNGAVSLQAAKRALQLNDDQTLMEDGIWRVRSKDCNALQGDQYWIGTLKPKGQSVAIYVGNKAVGTIELRGLESAVKMLKKHGGRQASCVVSQPSSGSWNVYVNMV